MGTDRYKNVPRSGSSQEIGDALAVAGYNPNVPRQGSDDSYGTRIQNASLAMPSSAPITRSVLSPPADPSKPPRVDLTTIKSPGGVPFTIAKSAAPAFSGFLGDLESQGYKIDPKQSGGYNPRKIAGTDIWSNHAYGTAVDVNWSDNPHGESGKQNLPANVGDIAKKWGLTWGGNWSGKDRDPMHFELASQDVPSHALAMTSKPPNQLAASSQQAAVTPPPERPNPLSMAPPAPQPQMDMKGIMSMAILQSMLPKGMGFHPVDYDPTKTMDVF
jgi:hypothetical protein